jgi:hypothetical protein
VLATQLEGEHSVDMLASLYMHIVSPDSYDEAGNLNVLKYDIDLGVLFFQPYEKPLEMVVGDWLVFDGHDLSVVANHIFHKQYRVSAFRNKKEKYVQRKNTHDRKLKTVRGVLAEERKGFWWEI